jgi:hypothetical protein
VRGPGSRSGTHLGYMNVTEGSRAMIENPVGYMNELQGQAEEPGRAHARQGVVQGHCEQRSSEGTSKSRRVQVQGGVSGGVVTQLDPGALCDVHVPNMDYQHALNPSVTSM